MKYMNCCLRVVMILSVWTLIAHLSLGYSSQFISKSTFKSDSLKIVDCLDEFQNDCDVQCVELIKKYSLFSSDVNSDFWSNFLSDIRTQGRSKSSFLKFFHQLKDPYWDFIPSSIFNYRYSSIQGIKSKLKFSLKKRLNLRYATFCASQTPESGKLLSLCQKSIRFVSNLFPVTIKNVPFDMEEKICNGDVLVGLNNETFSAAYSLSDLTEYLTSISNTPLNISVYRPSYSSVCNVELSNYLNISKESSVSSCKSNFSDTVHITISHFNQYTGQELESILFPCNCSQLDSLSSCKNNDTINNKPLVIDLRGNGGGSLQAALDSVSYFLPNNSLLLHYYGPNKTQECHYSRNNLFYSGPLLVWIDSKTASASEIFAAILLEHGRANLLGQRTQGKSLAQAMVSLADGCGLIFSISEFRGPKNM